MLNSDESDEEEAEEEISITVATSKSNQVP